ncbi:transcription antitermination factor NusB [bacterium]|nr:MAG: transcription antitermination factor NusB [bacterium]
MMRKRTQSREFALQLLYQIDISAEDCEVSLERFWSLSAQEEVEKSVKEFTDSLVRGTFKNLKAIDEEISKYAANWELKRMAVVDRNVLRLATYEIIFCEDIPPKVSINEAVELAKKYSGIQSGKFVNGILDKIKSIKEK